MNILQRFLLCVALALGALYQTTLSNNIQVTGATVSQPDLLTHSRTVTCSVSWDNSWRNDISGAGQAIPNNWDAAWVFVKFRRLTNANWFHATFSTTASQHVAPSGSTITVPTDGKGVFIYRNANGTGSVNYQNIQLRWNYTSDGVPDNDSIVAIKVIAVEMVYVPQGTFSAGDPFGTNGPTGCFYSGSTGGTYQVTSEGAITVGTGVSDLYYDNESSAGDRTGPIPAAFPKGYNAFYCMKYETSEGQYTDFLSMLPPNYAVNRYTNNLGSVRYQIAQINGVYSTTRPDRACNYLSWSDGLAYADWSGLRPMTELEYEKACRGIANPITNEYAWGTTAIVQAINLSGSEDGTETVTTASANCNYGFNFFIGGDGSNGPLRCGIFATGSSNRVQAGASYYGIMEMSGNLTEQCVTVGNSTGRSYGGAHGDGFVDANADANISGLNLNGGGSTRGGAWNDSPSPTSNQLRIADRNAAVIVQARNSTAGFRCVRTAP